ncbi:hypothetical protein T484DRAFT_1945464 [Baffinella frigidus]|nr:hypothetical protein T484DRAFT_1945464 [Cryptophyta sp. CCMP2293]
MGIMVRWAVALALLSLCTVPVSGEGDVLEFDAYRMVQYDRNGEELGSRSSALSKLAVPAGGKGNLDRKAVVLDFDKVTTELLDELLDQRAAGGLVIVLPADLSSVSSEARAKWSAIEQALAEKQVASPFNLQTNTRQVRVTNLQGWISGKSLAGDEQPPSIAIVAHYDASAIAPDLAGPSNLLFILTAAGHLNFAGTKHWLAHTDPHIVANIQVALCLDTIGSGDKLYMHTSKPAKDAGVSSLFSTMKAVADESGVAFEMVHRKINISEPVISWEHELFSRKRVMAATLSRFPTHGAAKGGIMDTTVDINVLERNILLIARTVARLVYGASTPLDIFEASTGVQRSFIEAWSNTLATVPRMAALLTPESLKTLEAAEKVLKDATNEANRQTLILPNDAIFYAGATKSKIAVYSVRPLSFDLSMTASVLAYLLALLLLLQGPAEAKKTLGELFQGDTKKYARSAKRA